MKAGAAARRYARAAFALGNETGEFERIGTEIKAVASSMESDDLLRDVLTSPVHDGAVRKEIVAAIVEKKGFTRTTKNLLYLLVDKDRMSLLGDISASYQTLSDEKAGRVNAIAVTATKVSNDVITGLTSSLEKRTGKKVSVSHEIDPALIGGIVVKIGDIIYDGSIRTQLQKLRDNIGKSV